MVFYRKYRSQTINELDSKSVRETLLSVLSKQDSAPHAFLFTGPKGLGKTSAARIIAKAVNCEKKSKVESGKLKNKGKELDSIEPCNECEQCKSITNGTNMDILEIDAASNRGIDEIRDLREKIRLSPLSAQKKVYIIDEVHMLTTEAFNALLKTLEEPPAHAMFVLCTTEPHKVPATILSRCFHIQFKLATGDEIVRSLKRIVEGEKLQADTDVLYMIAKMAEGGFRDAAKILEELTLIAGGQKLTKELFEKSFKTSTIHIKAASLLRALKARDARSGLQVAAELVNEGVDIRFFISELLIVLHKKLLEKLGVMPGSENESLGFEVYEIKELYELLGKAYQDMKAAVLPQLPLELAIIEYAMKDAQGYSDTTGVKEGEANPAYVKGSPLRQGYEGQADEAKDDEVTVAKLRKQAGTITKIKALYGSPKADDSEAVKKTAEVTVGLLHVNANGEVTPEWIAAFWRSIILEMKQYNHTIAGVLRSCSIKNYDKKRLVIDAAYKFHKERLEAPKALTALKNACKTLTGNDMEIEVELRK